MPPERIAITKTLPQFAATSGHTYLRADCRDDLIRIYNEKCACYLLAPEERAKLSPARKLRILVRHGETDWNIENRIQGHENNPMNERGLMQASHCGDRFAEVVTLTGLSFSKVHASPLDRARVTCQIILDKCGFDQEIITNPKLIERDFGSYSGLTQEERLIKANGRDLDEIDEVESTFHAGTRLAEAVHETCSEDGSILMVLHGGIINSMMKYVSDHQIGAGVTFTTNCCINVFSVGEDGTLLLEAFNLTPDDYPRWIRNELI